MRLSVEAEHSTPYFAVALPSCLPSGDLAQPPADPRALPPPRLRPRWRAGRARCRLPP